MARIEIAREGYDGRNVEMGAAVRTAVDVPAAQYGLHPDRDHLAGTRVGCPG